MLSFSCTSKVPTKDGWSLVWNDEFNGNKLDLTKWDYQIGTGSQYGLNGWGNDEAQYYSPEKLKQRRHELYLWSCSHNDPRWKTFVYNNLRSNRS